ncbi:MAG: class I SAM-dependent methyltransferase [Spirochaetes bacterium]|nr:class I SAM-dependent methyltransferase [Spirochaetota bacterium]
MAKSSGNISNMDSTLYEYMCRHSVKETRELAALRTETSKHILAEMEVTPDVGQFLHFLTRLVNARHVLELGTFTGYSTLWIALALPVGGRIITCETRREFAEIGTKYWKEAGAIDKIDLVIGEAKNTLAGLITNGEDSFYDFAFIDADKENYDTYYEQCLQLVRPGGLICIDNVLWNGRVIDHNFGNATTAAIRKINSKIYGDNRVDSCMISAGDGLTLVLKK